MASERTRAPKRTTRGSIAPAAKAQTKPKGKPSNGGAAGNGHAGDPRVAELEAELAESRRALAELRAQAEASAPQAAPAVPAVIDAQALEAANSELRNLTQNLDQIIRQRTRVLAESEAQLRRQNVELDRLNRIKSEFISIAAHELRTPMTSIVGYLDLIVEGRLGELPADLRRPMTSLRRNAQRLRRLVEDLLDASRLDTGRLALKRAPCQLGEIVQGVIDEMRPLADQKHQQVTARLAAIPPIDADADKLHQVVSNLMANSVKYTPEGGEIRLTVDLAPGAPPTARLRVWDNGIGIPPALRTRIFEPFSDVHTAKHHTSVGPDSAGLGLYIARGIVELHGGHIEVDSEEGRYSEFTVLLSLVQAS